MHTAGHASVAWLAGALVGSLGGAAPVVDVRSRAAALVSLNASPLTFAVLGLAAITVRAVGSASAGWSEERLALEVGSRLRLETLASLLSGKQTLLRPPDRSVAVHTQDGTSALTSDVRTVEEGVRSGLLAEWRAVLQILPLVCVNVVLSPTLTVFAFMVLIPFTVLVRRLRGAYKREARRAAEEGDEMLDAVGEAVRHADLWRVSGEQRKISAWVRRAGDLVGARRAVLEGRARLVSGASEVLGALALLLVIALAGTRWMGLEPRVVVPFMITFFLAYQPVRELSLARLALSRARVALERMDPWLVRGATSDDAEPPGTRPALGVLEVRGLTVAPGLVEPVSFRVEPGQIAVVTGPVGSGKTTLLRALLGLERPSTGAILHAGRSITEDPVGPARPFAWVPQDAPVLADTLAENVTFAAARPGVTASEILDRLASPLGIGEDERLGPGGRRVSGGERQWIALARAFATDAPVLLLDEPTSSLDADAQMRVLAALDLARGVRSFVIVTHRPEPCAIADVVVRLGPPSGAPQREPPMVSSGECARVPSASSSSST